MNTQKQTTQEISEPNQVSVAEVAEILGVPTGRVYVSAWNQPVYLAGRDAKRLVSLPVEGIIRSNDGYLVGVVRVSLNDKPAHFPVYFSPEEMVWIVHAKALQAQPELLGQG